MVFNTNYHLMEVKSIAVIFITILVLSIFKWPLKTGFTVFYNVKWLQSVVYLDHTHTKKDFPNENLKNSCLKLQGLERWYLLCSIIC